MLSRLAFRAGVSAPWAVSAAQHRVPSCSAIILRSYSAEKPQGNAKTLVSFEPELPVEEVVKNWDKANKIYYGPERDYANFPRLVNPTTNPPVRLGFIPESWFQLFNEKTGVTGPYVFGAGLVTFLLSKEIWIVEHGFSHFLAFWLVFYYIYRKYGAKIGEYLDSLSESQMERHWYKPMKKTIEQSEATVKEAEKMIWSEDGQKYLFEAKRENVDLQLEAAYRQRQMEVFEAVKKRLDYQLEVDNSRRRIEQQHMVQWIVDQVFKGITPQQERDSLAKCIQDLKSLASKNPAAV